MATRAENIGPLSSGLLQHTAVNSLFSSHTLLTVGKLLMVSVPFH